MSPTSSFGVNTSSMPACGHVLGEHAPHALEHRGDRRLVVGAEDRAAGVADDAVLDDRLELPVRRHGVQVRAEEERRPLGRRLDPRVDVAGARADPWAAVVLVGLERRDRGGSAARRPRRRAPRPAGSGSPRAPGRDRPPRTRGDPTGAGLDRDALAGPHPRRGRARRRRSRGRAAPAASAAT